MPHVKTMEKFDHEIFDTLVFEEAGSNTPSSVCKMFMSPMGDRSRTNMRGCGSLPGDQSMLIGAFGVTVSCTAQRYFPKLLQSTKLQFFLNNKSYWERNLVDLIKRSLDRPLSEYNEGLVLWDEVARPLTVAPRSSLQMQVNFNDPEVQRYLNDVYYGNIPGRMSLRVAIRGLLNRDTM